MMNDDDSIKPAGLVYRGRRLSASDAGYRSPPNFLEKFGDEAGEKTGGLIEPCTRLHTR